MCGTNLNIIYEHYLKQEGARLTIVYAHAMRPQFFLFAGLHHFQEFQSAVIGNKIKRKIEHKPKI